MSLKSLDASLVQELRKRAAHPDADVLRLLDELRRSAPIGGRVLVSDGDGDLRVLVPVSDSYEGPERLRVVSRHNPSAVLEEIAASGEVEVRGVRFREFVLSPLKYKGLEGQRPEIGFKGQGGDGWAPLGFDGWFWEDLALAKDLAVRGGVEVRPDVELERDDPSWRRLNDEERDALEARLGRRVPAVVHKDVIKEALQKSGSDDGAVAGALKSLSLTLEGKVTAPPPALKESAALSAARPALVKLFGAALFEAGGESPALQSFALEVLRGQNLPVTDAAAAVTQLLGPTFATTRTLTSSFLEAVIDRRGGELGLLELDRLRVLLGEVRAQERAELFGEAAAPAALAQSGIEASIRALHEKLGHGTGLDEAALYTVATRLAAGLRSPLAKPTVLVLTGKGGPGVDTLVDNIEKALERPAVKVQGASDLRGDDPVGFLVGSPQDLPGLQRGALVRGVREGQRFLGLLTGLEGVGGGVTNPEVRATAVRSLYSFVLQAQRDTWFRGYDPSSTSGIAGTKVDLAGGVLVLRTAQNAAQLRASLPPELWDQLAVHVVEFDKVSADGAMTQLSEILRRFVMREFQVSDAEFSFDERAKAFVHDLVQSGMPATQLIEMIALDIAPRLHFKKGQESVRVRIDLFERLTARERAKLRELWLSGETHLPPGVPTLFEPFDEGGVIGKPLPSSAELRDQELEGYRALIAELQLGASADQHKIRDLVAKNTALRDYAGQADERITQLDWLNTRASFEIADLTRWREAAQQTIDELKAQVKQLNGEIDELTGNLRKAKQANATLAKKVQVAVRERDEVRRTLSEVQNEFQTAISALGEGSAVDPKSIFLLVSAQAGRIRGKHHRAMLEHLLLAAAQQAVQNARHYVHTKTNKFNEIAEMTASYGAAAKALGISPDDKIMYALETAARMTGNGFDNEMSKAWEQKVGSASRYQGKDPSKLRNARNNVLRSLGIQVD